MKDNYETVAMNENYENKKCTLYHVADDNALGLYDISFVCDIIAILVNKNKFDKKHTKKELEKIIKSY